MKIRQSWLDYYHSLGFEKIAAAPLVHPAFPTSFNMSAGMVQLDSRIRSTKPIKPVKECLIQKCVRHYDINKVGDTSHLSFFEMTGSFEINDFNVTKTIDDIWTYLTQILKIDNNKLWVTAFGEDVVVDKKIKLPSALIEHLPNLVGDRIVFGGQETNLWTQGGGAKLTDNIKMCGPQAEFFYDLGVENGCGQETCNPFCNCGRFLEICNTLFILYYIDLNQEPTLKTLVNPSTETVIGIERCARIVEGKDSIFETSYFSPLTELLGHDATNDDVKIIVDHIKTLVFLFSEEAIEPKRRDRGRIIRTLIRNLLTSCYVLALSPSDCVPKLIDEVINMYKEDYPEIKNCKETVLDIVFAHEVKFKETIDRAERDLIKNDANNKPLSPDETAYYWKRFGVQQKLTPLLLEGWR